MKYLEWNDRLAAHFFRPEMAGRSVFVYVTQELLDELGAPTRDTWRDFVSAAKAGHSWRPSSLHTVCQKAVHCLESWRLHGFTYPAYLAYLGLFVLAAGKEGDFAPHAYYPRLRELLGDAGGGSSYPGFDKMWRLWEDLERWANEDMRGDLGMFTARIAGGWVHVGMPIAQTVLTEHERAALPAVFTAAALDPTAFPPDPELIRLLLAHGGHYLRRRTLDLVQRGADEVELVSVLLDIVKEELSRWDGQAGVAVNGAPEVLSGSLRLCAAVDRVASAARFGLRCSMNRDFPEEGILLRCIATGEDFCCQEEILHWSTEVHDASGRPVDATQFDWTARLDLRETQFGWRFTLRGNAVRVFVEGAAEGLPGIIEVFQLPASGPFYLAVSPDARAEIEAWGSVSCQVFRPVAIRKGLPASWGLYWSSGLASGAGPCKSYSALSPPSSTRLLLRGGIRASRRNWFLPFGLPEVMLEAPLGGEIVTCAGVELHSDGGIYRLPTELPREQKQVVEACRGGQVTRSQPFYVIGDFTWQWTTPLVCLDRFGAPKDSSLSQKGGAAGASVAGFSPTQAAYSPAPSCFERRRVFFVGREAGQIISWPAEPVPHTWQPVWAIPLERKGRAIFCGTDIAASEPLPARPGADRKKLKLWKELLYHRQKRIGAPQSPRLAQLWRKFQEAARRA